MRGAAWRAAAVTTVVIAAGAGSAVAAPMVERTIPLPAKVIGAAPGPGGGIVLLEQFVSGPRLFDLRTSARRAGGRPIWTRTDEACTFCADPLIKPFGREPDGTFGPVGPRVAGPPAYDGRGRPVVACPRGVTDAASTCITGVEADAPGDAPGGTVPAVQASTPTGVLWRVSLGAYRREPGVSLVARIQRDRAGRVYAGVPYRSRADGSGGPGLVTVALDPADGRVLWERSDIGEPVAGMGRGVITAESRGLAARAPDGSARWARADWAGVPAVRHVDSMRGRVTVAIEPARRDDATLPRIHVVRTTDGSTIWSTRPAARARWLHTDGAGRTYAAVGTGPGWGLVVFDAAGRPVWRLQTRARVRQAIPMKGGRVAVVTVGGGGASTLMVVRAPR